MLCALAVHLRADAWTQEQGHGQLILTSSLFETSWAFDGGGNAQRFDYGGAFRQFQLNPYLEYGLTSRTTLVVNTFVPFLKFSNQYGSQSSAGLGDVETGIRRRLNSSESPMPISVQFTVLFPTYPADRQPPPGNHQMDAESRLMIGRGARLLGHTAFWSLGGAYRYRSGAPADQFRSDATIGVDLNHRFMVMTQFFGITGLRNGQPLQIGGNPNAQSDFDLYKGQLSLVTRLGPHTRVQLGWNDTVAGRNTGRGQTYLIALWQDF
ncbi:MAG TPA: hypothetical protein VEV17_21965 [Bryobacteraceae bacterium]|nr:hypothetical protein [Bryobacteraceae bacterium]